MNPHENPEEIKSRVGGAGFRKLDFFASVVTQQQCYGHCPCDSAPHSS